MSIYSSGSKWKNAARGALASAQALEDAQNDVEFRRSLLSNIRQERLARAVLESGNYSDDFSSSSAAGATASIDSSLAGETQYSYETSKRMEQIQNYQQQAKNYMKKYQKQQKTRAMSFAITGMVAGAALGGIGAAALGAGAATAGGAATGLGIAKGAYLGAQIGQGVGQIASGTGQTQKGIQNILGGIGSGIDMSSSESYRKQMTELYESMLNGNNSVNSSYLGGSTPYGMFIAASVMNGKPDYLNGESFLLPQPNGSTIKAVKGCY
jgi:hypothetical protein